MRIIFTLLIVCCCNSVFCQSFYQIKWTSGSVGYTALIEYFDKEDINVRVKYKNTAGVYKVAKYKCKGRYYYDSDGKKNYLFDGENAVLVYPTYQINGYSADNFLFSDLDSENKFQKLYTYDNNDIANGKLDKLKEAEFKKLDPKKDFTTTYINSFFEKHEPEYKQYTSLIVSNQNNIDYYKLKFKNKCDKPVKTLIRYKNLEDKWETKGWWTIEPDNTVYVENSRASFFMFHAKSTDGTSTWKGDNQRVYEGKTYGFRKLTSKPDKYGSWITNLTCGSSSSASPLTTTTNTSVKDVTLHLIFTADTNDPGIGTSVRKDMEDVTNLFNKASRELGIKFEHYKLYGNTFDKESILSKINSLSVSSRDIIMFYYSGHGYNETSTYNKFPNMSLDGVDMGLNSMHSVLKRKNARLTITIGDLCNSIPRTREGTKSESELPFKSGFLFDTDKLNRLLIQSSGDIISTSSKKGEWSFCITNSNGSQGNGQFTNAFINAFTKETSKVNSYSGSWTEILNRAYSEAKVKTSSIRNQSGGYGQNGTYTNNIDY